MKIKFPIIISMSFVIAMILNNELAIYSSTRFYNTADSPDLPIRAILKSDDLLSDESETETLVINLWATWCGPCQKEIPQLNKLVNKYENENTLFLGVTTESENKVLEWIELQKNEPRFFILYEEKRLTNYIFSLNPDSSIKKGRYPELLPTNVIIHDKKILYFKQGYSTENLSNMDAVLNSLQ